MANRRGFSKALRAPAGLLGRLLRNRAGNTLAMVAAGLLPLLGLIGGGVDMSRIYLTKARMQQACDAGALAGRRMMGTGAWSANSGRANTTAVAMYNANFQANSYGSTSTAPTFTESSGTVTGTASATLPMTIMKIFGQTNRTIDVTCATKMEIPNTDVMFVLDTTGSMADCANGTTCNSNSSSKIAGLKKAVKCFYEALAKIDTSADCGSTPTGSNNPGVQLRFGFMPYATNVNVGKLLPSSYIADSWTYQSRKGVFYQPGSPTGSSYNESSYRSSSSNCNNWANSDTATGFPASNSTPATFTVTTNDYTKISYNSNNGDCVRRVDQSVVVYTKNDNGSYFHTWIYAPTAFDVSNAKTSARTVTAKIGTDGASRTVTWDGCIEERQTVRQTSYEPIDGTGGAVAAGAKDLDIDLVPTSDATTKWGPAIADLVFARDVTSSWNQLDYSNATTDNDYYNNVPYYCPATEAKKLQVWTGATAFENYVDSLTANGNTYHDIGILWGARFMSPTGIFASENAFTPTGGQIQRNMIFMSDGDTAANYNDYAAYGFPWLDRRETPVADEPSSQDLIDQVNARYAALCTAIKNRGITLWVISYGVDLTSTTQTRMSNCASPGKFFAATSTATLISNFQQIASSISQLRLVQ